MMSAKDKKKGALVPRLRFPEFIGDREWDCAQMGDIYTFKKNNSFSRDMLNYNAGDVKNIHYGDIHKNFSSHFYAENENIPFINCNINLESMSEDCLCTAGDIIFADVSEDMKDIGKCIEIISNNKERILSGLHTIFTRQCSSTLVIGFGGHLFQSPRVRAQIQKEAQGTKILGISSGRLAKISISFPFAKGEQQKIADCLSSLDERITAETSKLDTLKDHKKGLLKQLFPAEGETLPQLRFSEFRDAGEWEKIQLSKIAIPVSERATHGDADAVLTLSAEHGVVTQGVYFGKKVAGDDVKRYIRIKNNDFVYNDRTTKLYKYGTIKRLSRHAYGIVSPIYKCFRFNREEIPVFWEWYFESGVHDAQLHSIINEGAKEGRFNISIQKFLSIFVYFPNRLEQQRIADCLSSLDELISAQTQKIDLLKTHKKGLMQQLFPALDEAKA